MNFKKIKAKLASTGRQLINSSAKTLSNSGFTINSKDELKGFIQKSKNILFEDKETKEKKTFTKRVIVIFWDEKTDFFKKALYKLPILWAKAFSQNVYIKLAHTNIKLLKLEDYKIKKAPAMVVFENLKVHKVIEWEKNIKKVVKGLSLDINKTIDNL